MAVVILCHHPHAKIQLPSAILVFPNNTPINKDKMRSPDEDKAPFEYFKNRYIPKWKAAPIWGAVFHINLSSNRWELRICHLAFGMHRDQLQLEPSWMKVSSFSWCLWCRQACLKHLHHRLSVFRHQASPQSVHTCRCDDVTPCHTPGLNCRDNDIVFRRVLRQKHVGHVRPYLRR